MVEAAQAGDTVALTALQSVGRYLGVGIASLVNALNPNLVVFGGILSLAAEFLLPAITPEIQQRALPALWENDAVKVVVARHGADACLMGGVAMCYQAVIAQPGRMTGPAIKTQ